MVRLVFFALTVFFQVCPKTLAPGAYCFSGGKRLFLINLNMPAFCILLIWFVRFRRARANVAFAGHVDRTLPK